MIRKKILAVSSFALLCSFTALPFFNWKIEDDKYAIKFDTKGASGSIGGLRGTILFDEATLSQSSINVSVDVSTLNTGNGMKNKHAKGKDFLDAEHYPTIAFMSTRFDKTAQGYTVVGNLKIKEVTKEVNIPFTFQNSGKKGIFSGKFSFDRRDFKLEKKGIGEIVMMELNIPVTK